MRFAEPTFLLRPIMSSEDKHSSSVHGEEEKVGLESFDSSEVDEALHLVGVKRTVQFSEEFNLKLRRKLVCSPFSAVINTHDS